MDLTRRNFLSLAGAGLALPAAQRVLGPAAVPRTRPAAAGGASGGRGERPIDKIEHVVIFMQENRSFDHYFGSLSGVRGFDDPDPLQLPTGRNVFYQPDPADPQGYVLPFHLDTHKVSPAVHDLSHEWEVQHGAWGEGRMATWIPAHDTEDTPLYAPLCMAYMTREDLPFHYALADQFTICDNYHCSVMGPTDPNRLYLWTGTIDPDGRQGGPVISNAPETGYSWTTYPERLQRAGISWRVYQQEDNYDDNPLAWFTQYQKASTSSPLYVNGMARRSLDAFANDIDDGKLPSVSWLIAPTAQSEHPSYLPAAGADLIRTYLEPLAARPDVWRKTAFFLNYDENDGFFDHVVPPTPPSGTPAEFVGGLPIGLGFRVPMIVISPYSSGGWVCSEVFDHTSVLRFLEQRFGVMETNISDWRRQTCGDLTSAFDFTQEPTEFPSLPETKAYLAQQEASTSHPPASVPSIQSMPRQESGTRKHRRVPANAGS